MSRCYAAERLFHASERHQGMRTVVALVLAILSAFTMTAHADQDVTVGADLVSSTVFRGVGLEAGLRTGHWRARAGFAYQRIPSAFVEMDDRDKGWGVTTGLIEVAGDYWFGTARDGAYLTVEATLNRIKLDAPDGASGAVYAPTICPGAGYHWSPLGNALYVEPRLFLIVNGPAVAGSETVNMQTFHYPPLIPGGWIVVGAQF
jgi:hypothetical protein